MSLQGEMNSWARRQVGACRDNGYKDRDLGQLSKSRYKEVYATRGVGADVLSSVLLSLCRGPQTEKFKYFTSSAMMKS